MINKEYIKRILTSAALFILLVFMYFYTYILIVSLILISLITWIEFYGLITKILRKNNYKQKVLRFIYKSTSLLYLSFLTIMIIIIKIKNINLELFLIYSILISITTDIGGLFFGKIFKGKKLTKISPNKTLSGSIGSFILSLLLTPLFMKYSDNFSMEILVLIILLTSLTSQLGDLFISYIKRKAKVKNTSNLLPGHGGFLDRIDGIIFSIPIGFLLFTSF
tara:strand:+ start:432 stop:1097 length:666 start_codon:yes stop_codon:yes gene_type:complete